MNRRKFLTNSITLGSAAGLLPLARAVAADDSVKGLVIEKSKLVPHYTFANVPDVKVVVIPAQKGSDAMIEWLRKVTPTTDVTMSV